ncbi:hypothetical protein B1757_13275 [Acidithiobacillus marinus]|uniref:Type 4 secretion system PilS N-terminal domain-containing protein n=1 Tax=Acidithiobacillus marinus TaxID=187490 RepID=A0A2I1DIS6_9PROT|nr:hypothetical protein [Acidithiobacillus marinus]PKY09766.1 hypothetical protein B1757_13275 [Acidithiobacillus marinus]
MSSENTNVDTNEFSSEAGVSLITLLVALTLIVILGVLAIQNFNFGKSKGEIMYSLSTSLASAAKRMEIDTSCYPLNTAQLFNYSTYGSTTNTCGTSVSSTWNGPYINVYSNVSTNDNIVLPKFGPGVTATITKVAATKITANSPDANAIAVEFQHVPNNVANQAGIACGIAPVGGTTIGQQGNNCAVVAGTGNTSTFYYAFAYTNQ